MLPDVQIASDKIELVVATATLTVLIAVEIAVFERLEYEYLFHILVVTALLASFGDSVAKARELLAE